MERVIKRIEEFGESLTPSLESENKIWNVVNSKLVSIPSASSRQNKFSVIWFMKNSIKYSMIVFVICFIIAVPVSLFSESGKNGGANDLNISQSIANPSIDSTSPSGSTESKMIANPALGNSSAGSSGIGSDLMYAADQVVSNVSAPFGYNNTPADNTTKEADRAKQVNADLVYTVADVWGSVDKVYTIIADNDGYTTSVNTSTQTAYFVIKVPVNKFNSIHQKFRELAITVDRESIYSVDKQNEVSQYESSIKANEDKIADLKSKIAKSTDTNEKHNLQYEIDNLNMMNSSNKSNLDYLIKTTDFSTISLQLNKDQTASGSDLPIALQDAINMAKGVLVVWVKIMLFAIVVFIAMSPILVPVYLVARNKGKSRTSNVV